VITRYWDGWCYRIGLGKLIEGHAFGVSTYVI
jgi:hypothetical protein